MATMQSLLVVFVILTLSISSGEEFEPAPQTVYTPIYQSVSLQCGLEFLDNESIQSFLWKQGEFFLAAISDTGTVKYSDMFDQNKFYIKDEDIASKQYTLTIENVLTADSSNYTCQKQFMTTYENGTLSGILDEARTTELIVQDVPSKPGIPQIADITSRNATVTWKPSLRDNHSPITSYIINVKTMDQEWSESRALMVNHLTISITLHQLLPYTSYQVRVVAKNAIGNSTPSGHSSIFTTQPEVPSSPPLQLRALSNDSTQITLLWDPLPETAWNGNPSGYAVQYKETNSETIFPIDIDIQSKTQLVIEGVKPFTNYTVSIKGKNEIGTGPPAVIEVRTAEGVPSKPRIIQYDEMMPTSFVVFWEAPEEENGVLKEYQLQWIHNNTYKTRIITGHLTNPMSALISGLEPYTQYQLRVRASTSTGSSEYSNRFPALTDVDGPESPRILNLTVLGPDTIFFLWEPPLMFYKKINSYLIQYWQPNTEQGYAVSKERMVDGDLSEKSLSGLPTNNDYTLKIAAITQSIFSNRHYIGNFSNEVTFTLEGPTPTPVVVPPVNITGFQENFPFKCLNKSEYETLLRAKTGQDPSVQKASQMDVVSAGAIAGIFVGAIFVVVVVILCAGYRSVKCRRYYLSAFHYFAVPTNSNTPPNTVVFPSEVVEETSYPEIKVTEFLQHVRDHHADSDVGFSQEFEDINKQTRTDLTSDASYCPENKAKNRYINISAFDHSRVRLQPLTGRPRSVDFINANYIDGYKKPRAYIATQGPLPHTFSDFWRMVWEQGCIVIVMITKLVEKGRRKCDMYWPEEGTETYGTVQVKHINTFSRAHYTVRMFSLKSTKVKKKHTSERIVYQYHYTEWPDHGVPEFTLPVLKFTQKSAGINPPGAGAIVVHCSAGVGRTGTYILIDSMIHQIKDKGTVNIPAFLLHIRKQRNFLVQTEEQYMLVHDAIAEYILTQGDTEIRDYDISRYINDITKQINGERVPLDIQYDLVTGFVPRSDDMFHALKNVNQSKNRDMGFVPVSVKRVMLPVRPGMDGSDYINATYLQGFNKSNEFIVTQHPIESTMEDFWRLIWDQNSSVIVLLSEVDDEEHTSFWPELDKEMEMDTGNFKLTYRENDERKKYLIREFLLESTQDDYNLITRVVSPKHSWPSSCDPLHTVFDLVETVQELHKQNNIGPIIVVDRYGGVEAATFCALTSVFDQLHFDRAVNVYQLAKLYHLKRPGVIGTKENYLFLYRAAESLSKEIPDHQSSPGSVRLHLGSLKKNGTLPRNVTLNNKIETNV